MNDDSESKPRIRRVDVSAFREVFDGGEIVGDMQTYGPGVVQRSETARSPESSGAGSGETTSSGDRKTVGSESIEGLKSGDLGEVFGSELESSEGPGEAEETSPEEDTRASDEETADPDEGASGRDDAIEGDDQSWVSDLKTAFRGGDEASSLPDERAPRERDVSPSVGDEETDAERPRVMNESDDVGPEDGQTESETRPLERAAQISPFGGRGEPADESGDFEVVGEEEGTTLEELADSMGRHADEAPSATLSDDETDQEDEAPSEGETSERSELRRSVESEIDGELLDTSGHELRERDELASTTFEPGEEPSIGTGSAKRSAMRSRLHSEDEDDCDATSPPRAEGSEDRVSTDSDEHEATRAADAEMASSEPSGSDTSHEEASSEETVSETSDSTETEMPDVDAETDADPEEPTPEAEGADDLDADPRDESDEPGDGPDSDLVEPSEPEDDPHRAIAPEPPEESGLEETIGGEQMEGIRSGETRVTPPEERRERRSNSSDGEALEREEDAPASRTSIETILESDGLAFESEGVDEVESSDVSGSADVPEAPDREGSSESRESSEASRQDESSDASRLSEASTEANQVPSPPDETASKPRYVGDSNDDVHELFEDERAEELDSDEEKLDLPSPGDVFSADASNDMPSPVDSTLDVSQAEEGEASPDPSEAESSNTSNDSENGAGFERRAEGATSDAPPLSTHDDTIESEEEGSIGHLSALEELDEEEWERELRSARDETNPGTFSRAETADRQAPVQSVSEEDEEPSDETESPSTDAEDGMMGREIEANSLSEISDDMAIESNEDQTVEVLSEMVRDVYQSGSVSSRASEHVSRTDSTVSSASEAGRSQNHESTTSASSVPEAQMLEPVEDPVQSEDDVASSQDDVVSGAPHGPLDRGLGSGDESRVSSSLASSFFDISDEAALSERIQTLYRKWLHVLDDLGREPPMSRQEFTSRVRSQLERVRSKYDLESVEMRVEVEGETPKVVVVPSS